MKCTNRSGLYEKLENIQSRLSLCEKALAEYLETKRLAFPRFTITKITLILKTKDLNFFFKDSISSQVLIYLTSYQMVTSQRK